MNVATATIISGCLTTYTNVNEICKKSHIKIELRTTSVLDIFSTVN